MIDDSALFPDYTPRRLEQKQIGRVLSLVKRDSHSRVILLFGSGGAGKTYLIRHLPDSILHKNVVWLGPFDMDDSQYWTLTNLEFEIAKEVPGGYFQEYLDYMSQLSKYEQQRVGHETVLAYISKGDDVFVKCYERFVNSKQVPVIILDTIESIRGMKVLSQLLWWMKRLPGTLFILAGRPGPSDVEVDPIIEGLEAIPSMLYEHINLEAFRKDESRKYLDESSVSAGLRDDEKERIILLSQGHPLWLALTVYYLSVEGMPGEVYQCSYDEMLNLSRDKIGELQEAYIRQLLVPYQKREFWREAILRLGVVRRRVSKEIWQALMAERELPVDVTSWDDAWEYLLHFPWIRSRANHRYVTLHDALAEELAKRIIPMVDKSKEWRRALWGKAAEVYDLTITEQQARLGYEQSQLDKILQTMARDQHYGELVGKVLKLEANRLELNLLRTTRLYYQMLSDHEEGCNRFVELFAQAQSEHHYRFVELLWAEMQRLLPGGSSFDPLEDIVRPEVERFQQWYECHPEEKLRIARQVARYLYDSRQARDAERMLNDVWETTQGDLEREYVILNLRGNARMRIPGKSREAGDDFQTALARTQDAGASEKIKALAGNAYTELGYYYRNTGKWSDAANVYLEALRITPLSELQRRASIQSQYAYVQALEGRYQSARDLVETALDVRRKRGQSDEVGMALSVKGEIYRYERRYREAWDAYCESEGIFARVNDLGWLGLVRQEMAICLYQASQSGEVLPGYKTEKEMLDSARDLILKAVAFCKDYSVRSYPSALNRAGRIIGLGFKEYDEGMKYLEEGITKAREVADGWFWFANLVEFAELNYWAWQEKREERYLERVSERAAELEEAYNEYDFPDLQGRWELLQGFLRVEEALGADDGAKRRKLLEQALEHFTRGYPLIARGYVGSHGVVALPMEFKRLGEVMKRLTTEERDSWFEVLRTGWGSEEAKMKQRQETSLLAFITRLYLEMQSGNG